MLKLSLGLGRHRILVARPIEQDIVDKLDRYFEVEQCPIEAPLTREALRARLHEKAGLLATGAEAIDADVSAGLRTLKAICSMSEHCDNLDLPALTQAGIMVTNAPAQARPEWAHDNADSRHARALTAADNLIAAFGFGRIGGRPANLLNPELLCDCC